MVVGLAIVVASCAAGSARSLQAQEKSGDCVRFIRDVNYPDYSQVAPGDVIVKIWTIENCGDVNWVGYRAMRIAGEYGDKFVDIPETSAGSQVDIVTEMTVPDTLGRHGAVYEVIKPYSNYKYSHRIGEEFWVIVDAVLSEPEQEEE